MLSATFCTNDPSNHVPRMLDSQHRMGILLHSLSVEELCAGGFRISINVAADNQHLEELFLTRIAQMPGIIVFHHELLDGKAVPTNSDRDCTPRGDPGIGTQVASRGI